LEYAEKAALSQEVFPSIVEFLGIICSSELKISSFSCFLFGYDIIFLSSYFYQ